MTSSHYEITARSHPAALTLADNGYQTPVETYLLTPQTVTSAWITTNWNDPGDLGFFSAAKRRHFRKRLACALLQFLYGHKIGVELLTFRLRSVGDHPCDDAIGSPQDELPVRVRGGDAVALNKMIVGRIITPDQP